jgi:hypothetical protein
LGDISDAAPRLSLARHALPRSTLYSPWVNEKSVARRTLDLVSPRTRPSRPFLDAYLAHFGGILREFPRRPVLTENPHTLK